MSINMTVAAGNGQRKVFTVIKITKIRLYQLLLFIMVFSSRGFAGNQILCHAFYLKPITIEFGLLFRKAKDVETVEALNVQSRDLMFSQERPQVLEHLINNLLFYGALKRLLTAEGLEEKFSLDRYQVMYSAVKAEAGETHRKFNYFRKYFLQDQAQ